MTSQPSMGYSHGNDALALEDAPSRSLSVPLIPLELQHNFRPYLVRQALTNSTVISALNFASLIPSRSSFSLVKPRQ